MCSSRSLYLLTLLSLSVSSMREVFVLVLVLGAAAATAVVDAAADVVFVNFIAVYGTNKLFE